MMFHDLIAFPRMHIALQAGICAWLAMAVCSGARPLEELPSDVESCSMMDPVHLREIGLDRDASEQDQAFLQQMDAAASSIRPYWIDQMEWAGKFPSVEGCDATVAVNLLSREQMKHPGSQVDASTVGPVVAGFAMFMFISRLQSRHRYVFHASSRK